MWSTITTKVKSINIDGSKLNKDLDKGMDSIFKSMDTTFKNMGDLFNDIADAEVENTNSTTASFTVHSDDSAINITNNNGHIIIEGSVKSLKVNGTERIP